MNFDRVADRYDATRGGADRGMNLAADIAPLLDTAEPVFEIGVGTGVVSHGLRSLGFTTYGLDISGNMLARARDRLGDTLVQADAMRLPLTPGALAQMLSVWVLHVVGDVRAVMDQVRRCLRPGGRYLVMDGRPGPAISTAVEEILDDFRRDLGTQPFSARIPGFAEHAKTAGLTVKDIVETGPYTVFESASQLADEIDGRVQSWSWSIPDDTWNAAAQPAIDRLRALPDAAKLLPLHHYQQILILER
jgi:SAM-dependent methyltransferase